MSDILPSGRIETRSAVLIASELGFRSLGVQDAIFKGDEKHGIRGRV